MGIGSIRNAVEDSKHYSGKIKLGIQQESSKQAGKYFPKDTEYFVIDPKTNPELIRAFGEKPTSLPIMFTSNDEDEITSNYLMNYKCANPMERDPEKRKTSLVCKGQGIHEDTGEPTIAYYYEVENPDAPNVLIMTDELRAKLKQDIKELNEMKNNPNASIQSAKQIKSEIKARIGMLEERPTVLPRLCFHKNCPDFGAKKCKAVMTMNFKIPMGRVFGEYILQTSSYVGTVNILTCIKDVKKTLSFFSNKKLEGQIAGVKLILTRKRKQFRFFNPVTQRREWADKYLLNMAVSPETDDQLNNALSEQMTTCMFAAPPSQKMLPSVEKPGAYVVDEECPTDLFLTPEEEALAAEELIEDAVEGTPMECEVVSKEEWILDPMIKQLLDTWETKLGRLFPEGKRKAFIKGFTSKEEAVIAIRGKIGDAPTTQPL